MNSEPLMEKKGTPDSPATARASSVLPVPGGPTSNTPRGTFPPSLRKRAGSRRNATISSRSRLGAPRPATSSKRTVTCASLSKRRLPPLRIPARGPPAGDVLARRDIHSQNPTMSPHGNTA